MFDMDYDKMLKYAGQNPSVFHRTSEVVEKNIQDIVDEFKDEGLTKEKCIKVYAKYMFLLSYSSKTLIERIKATKYVDKNNFEVTGTFDINKIISKSNFNSIQSIYLRGIILPQLKKQDDDFKKWDVDDLGNKFIKYFTKHPQKHFTIRLVEDEMSDKCIKTMKHFCMKNFGRDDIFQFEILPKESFSKEMEIAQMKDFCERVFGRDDMFDFSKLTKEQFYEEIEKTYEKETGVKVKVQTAAANTYEQTLKSEIAKKKAPTINRRFLCTYGEMI